ncbi:MAG: TolC family protein [Verrucomicrobia bacterium]|nr:TolC family protein [Verrucomicrobiota bacterium]MBU4292033.1 TolC family protein [Verrucomicrobiota bacterium]MBU4427921.1 TolC family protein [Verrucomicrobiota bacterium]MCG2678867.1 TolC family protein [Kiritimatiellia bacterium]
MIYRFMAGTWLCLLSILSVSRAGEVSFTGAYAMAVAQSESLQISVAEWRAAEARYRQALGAMWPEVNAKGEANWNDTSDFYRAGLGGSWTVFDGFRKARLADARQADGLARSHDAEYARLLLYEDVADVFYQVLSFQDQRTASREQLKALESRAVELERRIKIGRSKRSDLLMTSNQIAETRLMIEQLNQACAATLELLAFVTGKPASDLQVVDQTPLPAIGEVNKYLATAATRDDIKAREASVNASRSDLGAAKSDRAPKVTLDGNGYPLRAPQDQGEWDLVLRLEMPLFDGGIRSARVAEAGQALRISELRLAELRRSSERDVRQAYQSLFYELRQWSELQTGIGVATETLALFQRDYELGRVNNLDVLTALVQFWGMRRREAALAHQLRAEMIHLHVAAGKASP